MLNVLLNRSIHRNSFWKNEIVVCGLNRHATEGEKGGGGCPRPLACPSTAVMLGADSCIRTKTEARSKICASAADHLLILTLFKNQRRSFLTDGRRCVRS